jgi:hypothetical protein
VETDVRRASLVGDTGGAVYVEFLMAFLPVMIFFVGTWQFTELCAADLVLKRAASAAVRAASVVLADDPSFYGGEAVNEFGGERRADVNAAAAMILSSSPRFSVFKVDIEGERRPSAPITAVVSARFNCGLGWVSLVCGGGSTRLLSARATYPYQGARYRFE